jgi:hypothetical protein
MMGPLLIVSAALSGTMFWILLGMRGGGFLYGGVFSWGVKFARIFRCGC